jgi:hypothetical protein
VHIAATRSPQQQVGTSLHERLHHELQHTSQQQAADRAVQALPQQLRPGQLGQPLHIDRDGDRACGGQQLSGRPLKEIEANAFAAALLMPEEAVRDAVTKLRSSTAANASRVVEVLAAEFDVSADAMGYRLINLGLSS